MPELAFDSSSDAVDDGREVELGSVVGGGVVWKAEVGRKTSSGSKLPVVGGGAVSVRGSTLITSSSNPRRSDDDSS